MEEVTRRKERVLRAKVCVYGVLLFLSHGKNFFVKDARS